LIAELRRAVESDFLRADARLQFHADRTLVTQKELDDLKLRFIQGWALDRLGYSVDDEQALAIGTTRGDVQVIARAGSGKTRTLITRALFMQMHCSVSPREILLLAFNKKAADEMRARLAQAVGHDRPYVMTFHALAYALLHPEQELLFDDGASAETRQSREVQEVIDECIRTPEHRDDIRNLMLAHFRDDWERIVAGGFQLTMSEFLAFRRDLPRESLRGEYVKSFGEKVIANALFEHGIEYVYERNVRWNGMNYRPDFTIRTGQNSGIVIEYFGLDGDPDYDAMSTQKREYWGSRSGWTLLEFTPTDLRSLGEQAFVEALLRKLVSLGIANSRRSEEDIWELIKRRAVDGFTGAMRTFIARCRKKNLTPDALAHMVERHKAASTAEQLFLGIGLEIYRAYLRRLTSRNREDFDGLMWRAADLVRGGQTRFSRDRAREQGDLSRLRFVMVDEFQDFSQMFLDLMMAVRERNPEVRFFCVGDDWQAINAFAGSELRFFTHFELYFPDSTRRYIRTNYRSAKSVVDAGNAVMNGRGIPAEASHGDAGNVWICRLDQFSPTASEIERHDGDEITPAVLRLVWRFLARGDEVALLSRRNGLPWFVRRQSSVGGMADGLASFVDHIRMYLLEEDRHRVTAATVHRYKGLQRRAVIVLDAVQRSFPLIHPNWVFLRVFGDTIGGLEEEERRLFYVAATRAEDSLLLVTEAGRQSPYVGSVLDHAVGNVLSWHDLSPAPSLDGSRLNVHVYGAYEVRDKLKDLKFRWHPTGKYWHKSFPAEGFSKVALLSQGWAANGVRVEIYAEDGTLLDRHSS